MDENQAPAPKGYGKRPMWQWALIYVVVAGLIYWLIYYFFMRGDGGGFGY